MTSLALVTKYRVLIAVFCIYSVNANGYETDTHTRMTEAAVNRSLLSQDTYRQLGLRLDSDLGTIYFNLNMDSSSETVHERNVDDDYTLEKFPVALKALRDHPIGWTVRGAVREDDLAPTLIPTPNIIVRLATTPQDDPEGSINRVFNHFYDPYYKRPLSVEGVDIGKTAVDWATGMIDSFEFRGSALPNELRRNHFTILDARESMYRALTGTDEQGEPITPASAGNVTITSQRDLRKAYWATGFRSLGDVLHLVQDVAQPQHSRNDRHTPYDREFRTIYEPYINWRAVGGREFTFGGSVLDENDREPLDYNDYPVIPAFARYTDYFSTSRDRFPNSQELLDGKGLADTSNREFFTAGKNLGNSEYLSPPNDPGAFQELIVSATRSDGSTVDRIYLKRNVTDHVSPHRDLLLDAPLTTEGVFDSLVVPIGGNPSYRLTRPVYDRMANILIPQGVAYAAGLLNHFFRGRLDITSDEVGLWSMMDHSTPHEMQNGLPVSDDKVFGFTKLRVRVRNDTEDIVPPGEAAIPQEMTDGFVQAVVKFNLNYCYKPDLTGQIPPDEFRPDGSILLDFGSTHSDCEAFKYLIDKEESQPGFRTVQDQVDELERVAVSKRIDIGSGGEIAELPRAAGQGHLFEFDFRDDPIPVNAREIRLQVLYRGKMGSGQAVEDDAIAVTTSDIPEPTYWTFVNSTDYVNINGELMRYDDAITLLNGLINGETDQEKRDVLINRRDAITDPSQPLTNFTCKSLFGNIPGLVTAAEIPAKSFVRVVVLTNMGIDAIEESNTQLGRCDFERVNSKGEIVAAIAHGPSHTAQNNIDQFIRDRDFHLFTAFPLFRGAPLKQGNENYYDQFDWGVYFNGASLDEEYYPKTVPSEKVQDINDPLVPEPVRVSLHSDFTWSTTSP